MKYSLKPKIGYWIDNDPSEGSEESSNVSTGGGSGTSKVRDPDKLLERFEATKGENKTLKQQLKELSDWKASQEAEAARQQEELLKQTNDWKTLLERKEKEYQDGLVGTKTQYEQDLAKYQGYETELETLRRNLEDTLKGSERTKAYNRFIRGLWKEFDAEADLDYFDYKFGDRISFDKEGKPVLDGEAFDLESFKQMSDTQMFWKKTSPSGNGTEPGVNNQNNVQVGNNSGTYELPRAIYTNPAELRKWIASKGLDQATYQAGIMKNLIKVVD